MRARFQSEFFFLSDPIKSEPNAGPTRKPILPALAFWAILAEASRILNQTVETSSSKYLDGWVII